MREDAPEQIYAEQVALIACLLRVQFCLGQCTLPIQGKHPGKFEAHFTACAYPCISCMRQCLHLMHALSLP